jgi:DNA-binding CsgD family transcriptional regulator
MNWTSSLSGQRYLTLAHQALFEEFAGNTVEAYQFAAQARECAPSVAFEVLGWGLSSAIARNAGEHYSAVFFAQRAQQLLGTLNLSDLAGEERVAMLCVAENCAQFDAHNAALLLADYRAHAPANNFGSSLEDPRIAAHESFIAGVVAQASNERERACTFYRRAFDVFDAVGYVRRASTAAHALVELTGDEAMRAYLAQRLAGTNNYITKSLKNRAGDALAALESNSIFASLPPAQREVVVLVCKGKTNKEIAQLRYVGEQTVKNMLTKNIFPAFGISSRAALVSACLRGLEPTSKRQSRRGT